ncbi:MAG: serine/threonine-protein kinase [Kofleriaceae bacterium]
MSRSTAGLALVPDLALGAEAEQLWIERGADGHYRVSVDRAGAVATATLPAELATAVIARLACVANVDLMTPRARLRSRGTLIPCEPAPGQLIGNFRVIGRLGEGGMGCVYQVEHATLGRPFALKVLHRHVIDRDANSLDRFLREARAASRIRHPHIIDVFDFGYLSDGRPYFVMELLEGKSLLRVIDRGGLPLGRAITIARQLGDALARAHECGVVHADVSAANVIVESGNTTSIKLVDFGLAELRDPTAAVTTSDVCFGTPCYIAPEVIRGNPADERSDQYSFGIVLWEMITGKPPFMAANVRALCMKHLGEPVPSPVSPHGPVPDGLVAVLERCLAKAPAARYSTMRAMLVELERVAACELPPTCPTSISGLGLAGLFDVRRQS